MRSKARQAVYSERAKATGSRALAYVASLEAEHLFEAERAWRSVLGMWHSRIWAERLILRYTLEQARTEARISVSADYDDRKTVEALLRFLNRLRPEDLISRGGA